MIEAFLDGDLNPNDDAVLYGDRYTIDTAEKKSGKVEDINIKLDFDNAQNTSNEWIIVPEGYDSIQELLLQDRDFDEDLDLGYNTPESVEQAQGWDHDYDPDTLYAV